MAFTNPRENIESLNLDDGTVVADLGSGSGAYALAAAEKVKSGRVYAVDVQKGLLEKLSKDATDRGLGNIEVIWADLEDIGGSNLKESSVDVLIISNILFLIENKDNFVKEAVRLLRPNGRALVVDWTDSFGSLGPQPENIFREADAIALFKNNGFEIEKSLPNAGEHHYGFIARLKKN